MAHREKRARAYAHLMALNDALQGWVQGTPKPYDFVTENKANEQIRHAKARVPIPDSVSGIIGDAIYNMRSALDHLAFALALENVGSRLKESDVSFPIHSARGSYMDGGVRAVRQMRPPVQDLIEEMQPYNGRNGPERHPLGRLNKLSNIDKHRQLAFTGSVSATTTVSVNARTRDALVDVSGAVKFGPFEDQAEVVHVRWVVTGPNPHVEMDCEIILDVAFPKTGPAPGEVVMTVLADIFEHISDSVFPPLERFL